jgi:hypothetical protein
MRFPIDVWSPAWSVGEMAAPSNIARSDADAITSSEQDICDRGQYCGAPEDVG